MAAEYDCSRKSQRCDACRTMASRVSDSVPSSALLCVPDIYPLIIDCQGKGTKDQLIEMAGRLQSALRGSTAGPIRIAARRAPVGRNPPGKWHDYTGSNGFSYKAGKALKRAPGLIGLLDPEKVLERYPEKREVWQDRVGTAREIKILVDFTTAVASNGDFEQVVMRACGEIYPVGRILHPDASGHASLHRLQWFAMACPEEEEKEKPVVTVTKAGYVRTKQK